MTPESTTTALVYSGVIAYICSAAIEWLKQQKWFPFLTMESSTLNRWVARLVAALSVVGIHATFNATEGTLLLSGLTGAGLLTAALEFFRQYLFQQVAYRKLVKPVASPPVPV